jgi:uncharacterized protein (TIGR02117 family)
MPASFPKSRKGYNVDYIYVLLFNHTTDSPPVTKIKSSRPVPRKWFSGLQFLVILFISLLAISACSTKPHVLKQTKISVPTSRDIYIVRHGWHTGFVVPASTIQSQLPQLYDRFGNTPYMEFGWGDTGFYQAEEISSGLTMKAIFWPTGSVIHAVAVPERPDFYFPDNEVETLCLDSHQYSLLVGFIEHSFYKDNDGKITKLKNGTYGDSQFYKGEGDYYLMNTCNTWAAKGLKSAGLNISPAFKLTAGSIMSYLSKHNKALTGYSCGTISAQANPES